MKTIFGIKGFALSEYAISANAILGIRDSGKTYTATEASEELFDAGVPFVWFDPIGVAHNLRVPGKGPGYPVVVAGGKSGDLPLRPENAKAIVRAAMESGVSLVIDLFSVEMNKTMWRKIVKECGEVLLYENDQYGLRHVFIEEAAEFVPQVVRDGDVFNVVEKMVRMGGNAKLGCTLINQRSEDMNKSVLELCANIFLHRQKGKNTLTGLRKWMNLIAEDEAEKIAASLPNLKSGQCWAFLHDIEHPVFLTIPEKNSLHPDRRATISTVQATKHKPVAADEFVAALKGRLGAIEEETKANDPRALKAEIAKLKSELSKTSELVEKINTAEIEEARAAGYAAAEAECAPIWLRRGAEAAAERAKEAIRNLTVGSFLDDEIATWRAIGAIPSRKTETPPKASGFRESVVQSKPSAGNGHAPSLGAELRILQVLAARHPARFTKPQWATLARMKRTGGTWQTYVSRLRTAGMIDEDGGTVACTAAGLAVAGDVRAPAQGSVIDQWKDALGSGPSKMIDCLLANHPDGMDRANLADRTGMTASGGTFQTYLSRLRSNGLVEVDGRRISLSDALFM